MRTLAPATLLLLLASGCSDAADPVKPDLPAGAAFTIADPTPWAGSRMAISSDAFVGLALEPEVRLDGVPIEVVRAGPATFEALLPTSAAGEYVPTISLGKGTVALPSISVAGFVGADELWFNLALGAQAVPGSPTATLVGASEGILSFAQLADGALLTYPGPSYEFGGLRTPGASYRAGVMFGQTEEGIRPLTLSGTNVVMDDPIPVALARQIAEVAEGVYLVTSNHQLRISDGSYEQGMEDTQGIALSLAAGRATVFAVNTAGVGLPVFTVPGGALAYLLTEVVRPAAVEFSPDGELLLVAGAESEGNMLRIFRASDGELLEELALPTQPVAVGFDPARPLFYVGVGGSYGQTGETKPGLMIFDRTTFALLGHATSEAAELACESGCVEAEIAVSEEPAVYIAGFLNSPVRTFRFSIPEE